MLALFARPSSGPAARLRVFDNLPANHRIEIAEGSDKVSVKPFAAAPQSYERAGDAPTPEPLPSLVEAWLIDPLNAPDFSLPDLAGKTWRLGSFRGSFLLLNFWTTTSPAFVDQMRLLQLHQSALSSSGLRIVGIIIGSNADEPNDSRSLQSFLDKNLGRNKNTPSFPLLLGTQDVAGVYNIIYRYLFDRRRDLALPTSFLVDQDGMIVKVYQGPVDPKRLAEDVKSAPRTAADRAVKALPLPGTLYLGEFQRNDFTYGVAFFQHGYLEQAEASFKQVIATKPDDPEAYYNLGTLYLRRNALNDARTYLEQTVKLRPNYPEAWNNLGMLAAQQGNAVEATRNFQQSLQLRPDYAHRTS